MTQLSSGLKQTEPILNIRYELFFVFKFQSFRLYYFFQIIRRDLVPMSYLVSSFKVNFSVVFNHCHIKSFFPKGICNFKINIVLSSSDNRPTP